MTNELDSTDWKILNQLDLNCRQSDSEIGRKVRISKQVITYRIKQLLKKGVITSFFSHINIANLGFGIHKIYLQLGAITKEKELEMWAYLTQQPRIVWVISCSGRWDIIFGIASRNIEEFNDVLSYFMDRFSEFVAYREITVFNKATLHHRKWFPVANQQPVYWLLGGPIHQIPIDNVDKQILVMVGSDARMSLMAMAQKTGISSSLLLQRIKKLKEKNIIGAFRLGLDRQKLGIHYCKSFVYYQNKTSVMEKSLLEYCYALPQVLGLSQSIGPWDLELEFEVQRYDDFHHHMKSMKNSFSLIRSFDTVYIEKESGDSFLPRKL